MEGRLSGFDDKVHVMEKSDKNEKEEMQTEYANIL
jgi:hypothetical protein